MIVLLRYSKAYGNVHPPRDARLILLDGLTGFVMDQLPFLIVINRCSTRTETTKQI